MHSKLVASCFCHTSRFVAVVVKNGIKSAILRILSFLEGLKVRYSLSYTKLRIIFKL